MKKAAVLALMLAFSVILCGCGKTVQTTQNTPPVTAIPTVTPDIPPDAWTLSNAVKTACASAASASSRLLDAVPEALTLKIPEQNASLLISAVQSQETFSLHEGQYTFSQSSGGDFVYEKPYSAVIYGDNVDVFEVQDDDQTTEVIENTVHDPMMYVLAGEGGGAFAYASYYVVEQDASRAEMQTISRLNGVIGGYSHYEYAQQDDAFYFADAQLNLGIDQTQAPYRWSLCVGAIEKNSADVFEFSVLTDDLNLPAIYPDVFGQRTVSPVSYRARFQDQMLSQVTWEDKTVAWSTQDGIKTAELQP